MNKNSDIWEKFEIKLMAKIENNIIIKVIHISIMFLFFILRIIKIVLKIKLKNIKLKLNFEHDRMTSSE